MIKVLDRPAAPTGPVEFTNVTADSMNISWKPPINDGGSAVNNYTVDIRETNGVNTDWRLQSGSTARTTLKISRLTPDTEYQFRIRAENRFGIGHPLESKPMIAQYPFTVSCLFDAHRHFG